MSYPRISVFAGSANGTASPTRVIEGQETLQARTSHDISVDALHDEIAVPNPFAQAILFFSGGAKGAEAPIRILQGPKTMLNYSDNVTLDPIHREAYVAQLMTDTGDVAPRSIISGPKTGLGVVRGTRKVIFSPQGKKIIATGRRGGAETGELFIPDAKPFIGIWNYGDNGDVPPWAMMPDTAAYSMDLNPAAKELITVDRGKLIVYRMPQLFQ